MMRVVASIEMVMGSCGGHSSEDMVRLLVGRGRVDARRAATRNLAVCSGKRLGVDGGGGAIMVNG